MNRPPVNSTDEASIPVTRSALRVAATHGALMHAQVDRVWEELLRAASLPPTEKAINAAATTPPSALPQRPAGPRFTFVNTLHYLGGLLAIGAMTLFMTLGWDFFGSWGLFAIASGYFVAAVAAMHWLRKRDLPTPAGLLGTLAVALVSLAVWAAQHAFGAWPPGGPVRYASYHAIIDWRWLSMELATLAVAAVLLWRYRLPFMTMPVAVTLWYLSMDFTYVWERSDVVNWSHLRDVSLVFGVATCALAAYVDVRNRRAGSADFAFWLYLFGALMFWAGLSWRSSDSELARAAYAAINVALIFGGALIGRRVFTILGGLGLAGYLGHLAHRVFADSIAFPFVLTALGFAVIALGIWWQKRGPDLRLALFRDGPA